ncbi:serine dehydratase subunit alpha family protein [Pseudoflavonifractor phocaeensis]|uniref:L-cysteine desulfidase family protein n=1 Tax=Pseudoflavonifractor phocaeensis TaxID=1870988 RepID=UPI001F1D8A37|nr:L-serine ammonia-lyase, iron-sulfur-dependent, subunit alpha [Pseudoflavonifractor phocaeensis]MCF2596956.1 serine dehydratase subunit alpha family protein [Pseudoflavonifractor phocaeensis]
MEKNDLLYQTYLRILERELVPAMGCTEPIAIAYCAALARSVLKQLPTKVEIQASGNIIKNVKSVVVPNTGNRRGIEVAAAIGILGGDESAQLEVISHVSEEVKNALPNFMTETEFTLAPTDSDQVLDIVVTVRADHSYARVRIAQEHTNVVLVEKDGSFLHQKKLTVEQVEDEPDYTLLSMEGIFEFAQSCDLNDVRSTLDRQINFNSTIAEEGLRGDYGANIGRTLLQAYGNTIQVRAKAKAAAASDARMNGCELPVVINSGSGNQGITVSLPVIEYAKELNSSQEDLYRALLISNLTAIHEKNSIGRLSAFCGAVSAGSGAGAGIAYLMTKDLDVIVHTVVNALAIASGIVCDGAKSSCAAKIGSAVDAGILGYEMYRNGQQFYGGDGLLEKGIENTIRNIGRLGRVGMRETDREIIRIMTGT